MLAIVIPYFKITFFEQSLKSLSNQTDKRFNVYIGNDASPENPELLLEKYNNTFNYIYKKFETNLGSISLVKQWNRCLDLVVDEKWVMILGDDDVLADNYVEEFYKNINEVINQKIKVIRFATQIINDKDDKISDIFYFPKIQNSLDFLSNLLEHKNTRMSLSEYIFEFNQLKIKKIKEFPLAWNADLAMILECSEFNNIYTINNSIQLIRKSKINITGKHDNVNLKNKSNDLFADFLLDNLYLMNKKSCKIYNLVLNQYYLYDKLNINLIYKLMKFNIKYKLFKNILYFPFTIIKNIFNKK